LLYRIGNNLSRTYISTAHTFWVMAHTFIASTYKNVCAGYHVYAAAI